ncbi:MAG: platelet-activating factor acetylhydrolase IB subunit [Planctomycetaceae bacterium]
MIRRSLLALMSGLLLAAGATRASAAEKKLHSAIRPVPRKGGWMKRHEKMNARVAKGHVDLVFIGDSITHGWEGRGRKVWQKYYGKRNAVNLGIGGDRTQHVIWRLQNGNLKGISPKLAVIMIGTNNAGSNSPRQIADGVTEIVNIIRKKTPKTKILLLATFPRGKDGNDKRRQVNERSNAIVAKLADEKSVFYLDIGKKFLQDDGVLPRDIMPDLLHPNQKGYEIWAKAIEPSVKKLMGE